MTEPEHKPDEEQPKPPAETAGYDVIHPTEPEKSKPPSLMEGIDEDADFDADPAIKQAAMTSGSGRGERRVMPNPLAMPPDDEEDQEEVPPTDALVKPGLLSIKSTLMAGSVIALVAGIISFVTAPGLGSGLPFAALTLYLCALHAVTGFVAVVLLSLFQRQPIGSYLLGAGRMLCIVGAFMAIVSLRIPYGLGFPLAACLYMLLCMVLFRVRPNIAVRIAGFHAAIATFVQLGFLLQEWSFGPTKGER